MLSAVQGSRPSLEGYCYWYSDYSFQDSQGSRHALGIADAQTPNDCGVANPQPTWRPNGGDDFLSAHITTGDTGLGTNVYVADADGTVYSFTAPAAGGNAGSDNQVASLPTSIEDRNGNQITTSDSGNGAFTFTDTLDRAVISSSGFGTSGNTVTVSGLSAYTVDWTTATTNVSSVPYKLISGTYCGLGISGIGGTQSEISSILLPNGQSYSFTYDPTYGLLSSITYPSGAVISYTWALNLLSDEAHLVATEGTGQYCEYEYSTPALATRTVMPDGHTAALQQVFTYTTTWNGSTSWTQKTTTVQTTDLITGKSFTNTYTYGSVLIAKPLNDTTSHATQVAVESSVVYGGFGGGTLRTVNKTWQDQYLVTQVQETLPASSGTVTSETDYTYTTGAQLEDQYDYDFGTGGTHGAILKHTHLDYASFAATPIYSYGPSIFDRPSDMIVCATASACSGSNRTAETDYTYDGAALTGTSEVYGHDYSNYIYSYTNRGNRTSATQKCLYNCASDAISSYVYDDTGQVTSKTHPCGYTNTSCPDITDTSNSHTTTYTYSNQNAYLATITYPPTNGIAHTESFGYNAASGELTSFTDENGQITSYSYSDPLARLTQATYPATPNAVYNGHSCSSPGETTYSYDDVPGSVSVTTSKLLCNGVWASSTTYMDGQGRPTKTMAENNAETDTTYNGLGQVLTVSNPYFNRSDGTYGLTTTTYDALARVTLVTRPDQSTLTTSYSGNSTTATYCTTVTDEQGISRTSCSDGLGRIISATDAYGTAKYTYDALNDLTGVSQGSQTRAFAYDSLARLTSATEPESGATTYTHDVNGNMVTRQDARSITTTYTYDDLNRVLSKTYSDGTPTANFGYDESSVTLGSWTSPSLGAPVGRPTHTKTMSGSTLLTATVQDYDPMGRTRDYWQCTPLNCGGSSLWAALYTYDLAGDVTSWNHPAGFTVTQNINGAQQISQVTSSVNNPASLATITYTAFGAVQALQNGCTGTNCTPPQETYLYNKRLQPAVIELGSAGTHAADSCRVYNYYVGAVNASACSESPSNWPQGTNNNGDVAGYYYNDNANSGLKHAAIYQYDGANRLAGAAATGSVTYSQTFGYDAYGNMSCSPPGPGCVGFSYNPNTTTNQVTNAGYSYDLAGDLQTDGMYTYQWDAESRMVGVYQSGNVVSLNTYNALGQRVEDITQNSTTDEAYGAGGNLLLRYTGDSNSRSFVPFGGGILAEYFCGGIIFDHPDEIGSVTTSTDCTGSTVNEKLFKPFGESWTGAAMPNLGMHQEFAQLPDYDPETDQYNTLARHYTPMGRWMSPDPGGLKVVNLSNPQTWNMYAYATNNPTTLTDPSGLNPFPWLMANEFGQMLKMADKLTGGLEELEWENEEYEEYQQSGGGTQVAQATTEARSDPDQAQNTMSLSSKGLDFIKGYEKLSLKEYKDQAGYETIGYGHKVLPSEDFSKGVTKDQALTLLKQDVQTAVGQVNSALKVSVKQNQFDALVSLAFNAGGKSVLPSNQMMRAVNAGSVTESNFTAYRYIHVDGRAVVSQGLLNRREAEYQMYSGGP
jgi:RHS repeat-associated protein